jgi:Tol biopolymer transport system component
VYVVAAIGGEPRKIAPGGFTPKFSPDGAQLAFVIDDGGRPKLMVVPTTGGPARGIAADLEVFGPGVWSPDGSHLLAAGRVDLKGPTFETFDWFAISLKDGTVVRTGATAALKAQKVAPNTVGVGAPSDWTGGSILFTARTADAANVWKVAVNATTFKLAGPAERLTFGTAQETFPTMSLDGTLVFAAADTNQDYWALPIDTAAVSVKGPRTQIMKNSASDQQALSLDGNTLIYCSHRSGQSEIRSRDLRSGKETMLISSPIRQHVFSATADGTAFLYSPVDGTLTTFLGTTSGAPPRKLCENCDRLTLSKDGSKLLYMVMPDRRTFHLLDLRSGQSTKLLSSATSEFTSAQFAPDDRWVAVTRAANEQLLLVPVRDSQVDEKEMIEIGRLPSMGGYGMIRFSPDGNTIYYLSNEDGNACIYAQRLSPSRQPAGAPVLVQHLHEANTWGHPHGMRVGGDKIVLLMNQGSSNIWLMHPRK